MLPAPPAPWDRRYWTFCWGIRELQIRFGFSVTRWWSTPGRNAALEDAKPDSQHLAGTAVDVVFDGGIVPPPGLFVAVAREYGIEAIREKDHWHLEHFTREL